MPKQTDDKRRSSVPHFSSALLAGAAALALCGCSGTAKDEKAGAGEAATPVQVAKVTRDSIQRIIAAEAILYPITQSSVTAKISAPVREFNVNRGAHVRRGQLLGVLENRDLVAAVQENKGLVEQAQSAYQTVTGATMPEEFTKAQADVQAAKQALDAAQKVYENRQKLLQEGALAQKLVDDAKVAMVQAQSTYDTAQRHLESLQNVGRREQVKNAQAQVDAAKARYQNAEAQLSYAEIRSPIDGVIADRPLNAGEMVSSGSAIISVMNISTVVARANIPVAQAALIRVGKPATISAPSGDVPGKVTVVSPAVDPNTTTVEVWVQAANPGEVLKPGVTVRVSINAQTINDAIVVPPAALLSSDEGGDKVMVVSADSVAHERKVEVGVREADKVQITQGLQEGEMVVTVGGLGLEDKAKVKIQKAGEGGKPDEEKDSGKEKPGAKGEDDKK